MALLKKCWQTNRKNIGLSIELMRSEEENLSNSKAKSDVCPVLIKAWAGIAR